MPSFTAPPAGTIERAGSSNPISQIIGSIAGLFIGILLVLFLAPVVLWYAESQNSAKVFSHTLEVSPTSGAKGYIRTTSAAIADSKTPCYQNKVEGNCLYYDYKFEELQSEAKEYCGTLMNNQKVIETKGQKCDSDGRNCQQCYLVNESNWFSTLTETKSNPFSIGNFKVNYPEGARVVGAQEYKKQIDETHRENLYYLKDNINLLVAGDSDGNVISHGGSKKFLLVSAKDYQGTYEQLRTQDRIIAWILRILTFIILLIGYNMIFGPISTFSYYVGKIPFIGKWIDGALRGTIFVISLVLAIAHFIILWVLIILIKNIIYVAILIGLGIAGVHFYTHYKKKTALSEPNLSNQQLVNYIKKYSTQGYNVQQLRTYLLQKGYSQKEVDQAIKSSNVGDIQR